MDMSMMLSTIELIIKDTDGMFISFSVIHSHLDISWMVKEYDRLSEEIFLMSKSA